MIGRKKRERERDGGKEEREMEGKRERWKERGEGGRGGRWRERGRIREGKVACPWPGRKLWFAEVHDGEIPRGTLQSSH